MTETELMLAGENYNPADKTLSEMRARARSLTHKYNQTTPEQSEKRAEILNELFGSVADTPSVQPGFHCDYGSNISVGENFYMNYGGVILDCAKVTIGDNCFIGPQVGIYTACHPVDPQERNSGVEFARSVTIGNSCWIGGHAVINPGVTLGDNVVVASGAVVTKSFGDNVIIGGNPAREIKTIAQAGNAAYSEKSE